MVRGKFLIATKWAPAICLLFFCLVSCIAQPRSSGHDFPSKARQYTCIYLNGLLICTACFRHTKYANKHQKSGP
ncbi:hypothetical protein BC628DRAFT_525104 [Trametes gibbosa]|nr:hypothetical protein BC628DRAFT_525104 [Trametes gibbosa]